MKILFLADPIETLSSAGDSSLVMAQTAAERGHEIFWASEWELNYCGTELHVTPHLCRDFSWGNRPKFERAATSAVNTFDAILIRKDPPFDEGYTRLCWLLSFEEKRVWMMNRPSDLVRYHEKLVPYQAFHQGFLEESDLIPMHLGSLESAQDWVRAKGFEKVIAKPFLGYGGNEISLMTAEAFFSAEPDDDSDEWVVQPFCPEVEKLGDRRIFFVNGDHVGDFIRMPRKGDFVSNLAQGGTAELRPMDADEKASAARLGKFLKQAGIVFAGADMIGPKISEVNITSPTGLVQSKDLEDKNYGEAIVDAIEAGVAAFKKS